MSESKNGKTFGEARVEAIQPDQNQDLDLSFKVYYELMSRRISEVLLISSPYEAFILEEDGRLSDALIGKYRGLSLTHEPHLTWVSTAQEALEALSRKHFDLVIKNPGLDDMDPYEFAAKVKAVHPNMPVLLLAQDERQIILPPKADARALIDRSFVWQGNSDLFLAMIKSMEDRLNVNDDTRRAKVRVIVLVDDSPAFVSSLLPFLYREVMIQTQTVMEDSASTEHKLKRMRARPKILLAENFEEAADLCTRFGDCLLGVFSDARFSRNGRLDDEAGFALASMIRKGYPDIPFLMFSSEETNRQKAEHQGLAFLNKHSSALQTDIRSFMLNYLGFGDFIFRIPDGREVGRASNMQTMEKILPDIPDASIVYHSQRNDFSNWLMARSEIYLARMIRPLTTDDFSSARDIKEYLITQIRKTRHNRQQGLVADFGAKGFDPEADFVKIGNGSLGGKARGLAFIATLLKEHSEFQVKFKDVLIRIPKTLVISTQGFDAFFIANRIQGFTGEGFSDDEIIDKFLRLHFPDGLRKDLEAYLRAVAYPLAVRSSSLLEDAQYHPCAGIYKTFMIPNNHPNLSVRLFQLIQTIKMVYASTFLSIPRSFAQSTAHRIEEEKMAVIVQQITGLRHGDYFYPAVSGVAQSYNFYPVAPMKPQDGIVHIAVGLGKTVVEGGAVVRFSPLYPRLLPQFATVEDVLKNSQRLICALQMKEFPPNFVPKNEATLIKLEIEEIQSDPAMHLVASTYMPEDERIRDAAGIDGYPVITFAGILKHGALPLPEILSDLLDMGRIGMGTPVEIEFAVNFPASPSDKPEFSILQIRPMALSRSSATVAITDDDRTKAICYSENAMGNGLFQEASDIVIVRPETFNPSKTVEIASEINQINRRMIQEKRRYILIGPGRWGTADPWLGIPVSWSHISAVDAIVEIAAEGFAVDPSQGTHFFHNLASLGISYLTIPSKSNGFINWRWIASQPAVNQAKHLIHIRRNAPFTIKVDGKTSSGVILP